MIPVELRGKNVHTLTSEHSGVSIPVIASKGNVFSCWQPSKEEVQLIKNGHPVWVVQRGNYIPEMTLQVGREDMVVPRAVRIEKEAGPEQDPVLQEALRIRKDNQWWGRVFASAVMAVFVFASICILSILARMAF